MDYYEKKYPIFKDQDSLWAIIQERKQKFIDICVEKGITENLAEYIIKKDFERYREAGTIGSYYLLYKAFKNADISYEDVGGKARNSLQYILGFSLEIDGFIKKIIDFYNVFGDECGKEGIEKNFFRPAQFSDLYITVAQTKYISLNEEIVKLLYKAENISDLVIHGEADYIFSMPEEKKGEEIFNRIKWQWSSISDIAIYGNNLIGKEKVEYEAGELTTNYISKWVEIHNKLNEILADSLNEHIKFALEVYLENGDASGPNGMLVEYPVLAIYVSKKLILSRNIENIESYMDLIESISMASDLKDFKYDAAYDEETVKRLIDKKSDDELYNELMKLSPDIISELYDNCNRDIQSIIKYLPIYKYQYGVMTSKNVGRYDLVYSTYDQDKNYELYDVIDFSLIDKCLDNYIEDSQNSILYDSYNGTIDLQYFMYILLNILDKHVDKEIITGIYKNQNEDVLYTYDKEAVKGLSWMRLRAEGITIKEDD